MNLTEVSMARVYSSAVIHAPVDRVCELGSDFNGLPQWHPAIRESEEAGLRGDQMGCVRRMVQCRGRGAAGTAARSLILHEP
jgi:hypothetical protein